MSVRGLVEAPLLLGGEMKIPDLAEVQVRQCVITTLTRRGGGVVHSVIRPVIEIWDVQTAEKLGEYDAYAPQWNIATDTWKFPKES